jgi:hypothetical protein
VALNFTSGDVQRDPKTYRVVQKAILSTSFGAAISDSQMRDDRVSMPANPERVSLARVDLAAGESIYLGTLYCKPEQTSLIGLFVLSHSTDESAMERLGQIGCPGGESTPSPSFESLVDAECQAGNAAACEIKSARM